MATDQWQGEVAGLHEQARGHERRALILNRDARWYARVPTRRGQAFAAALAVRAREEAQQGAALRQLADAVHAAHKPRRP